MKRNPPFRRRRERRTRKEVFVAVWWFESRAVISYSVPKRGEPKITVLLPPEAVPPTERHRAAFWLEDYLPHLSFEQRYQLLWQAQPL